MKRSPSPYKHEFNKVLRLCWTKCVNCKHDVRFERLWRHTWFKYSWHDIYLCKVCAPNKVKADQLFEYQYEIIRKSRPPGPPAPPPMRAV